MWEPTNEERTECTGFEGQGSVSTVTELVMVAAFVVAGFAGLAGLPALADPGPACLSPLSARSGSPFSNISSVLVALSAVAHFGRGTVLQEKN